MPVNKCIMVHINNGEDLSGQWFPSWSIVLGDQSRLFRQSLQDLYEDDDIIMTLDADATDYRAFHEWCQAYESSGSYNSNCEAVLPYIQNGHTRQIDWDRLIRHFELAEKLGAKDWHNALMRQLYSGFQDDVTTAPSRYHVKKLYQSIPGLVHLKELIVDKFVGREGFVPDDDMPQGFLVGVVRAMQDVAAENGDGNPASVFYLAMKSIHSYFMEDIPGDPDRFFPDFPPRTPERMPGTFPSDTSPSPGKSSMKSPKGKALDSGPAFPKNVSWGHDFQWPSPKGSPKHSKSKVKQEAMTPLKILISPPGARVRMKGRSKSEPTMGTESSKSPKVSNTRSSWTIGNPFSFKYEHKKTEVVHEDSTTDSSDS